MDGGSQEESLTEADRLAVEAARAEAKAFARSRDTSRRVTINDVARLAGVSKKTISRIINDSPNVRARTRAVVQTIMEELSYRPDPAARGLNYRHAFLVGLIYDNPNPHYVVTAQEGILDVLGETEYELLVHPCDRADPAILDDIRTFVERQRLYGVILTPSVSEDERVAALLRELDCRHIRIASVELGEPKTMLVTNDAVAAREAGRHIVEMGHRRVAHLAGREGFRSSEERLRGYREALREHGMELPESLVFKGDYTFESGTRVGEAVARMAEPPTAIFCANDQMAAGFMQAVRRAGMAVPDDVSVVGYDDFQIAQITLPRLSTLHSPTREFARVAALRLLELEVGPELAEVKAPWLVVRGSSGPAPGIT